MADPNGLVARTVAALRYVTTGVQPTTWFGPGVPLPDQAPPEVRGRQFDYPAYLNLNYRPRSTEKVGFDKLKLLAATCEPLKMVMARQRDLLKAIEWSIKPRKRSDTPDDDPMIGTITDFLEMPDGEHDWSQWIGAVLDQLFVLDAVSIYARPTLGGDLHSLELIDGATITPLVDQSGRRPTEGDAYKQVLKGLPAISYTSDELTYFPENYRVDRIYGWSRVEQIIETAEMQIERMKSQKGYFTHGNVGDGYFTAPTGFTLDQIASIERSWNAMMSGDNGMRTADRRQSPFLPQGTDWHATKVNLLEDTFDEWLVRLVCFPFGVAPTPFLKQQGLGHGSATTDQEAAAEGGLAPLMQYVQRLMTRLIATRFERPDLEFAWIEDREFDPKVAADIDDLRLRNGTRTIDEVRDRNGDSPLPDGLGAKPMIYTTMGAVLVADVVDPPEPEPVPPALAAVQAAGSTEASAAEPANDTEPAKLAKAAAAVTERKIAKALSRYLAAKGKALAGPIADALGLAKAAPSMDDYSGRIDDAFDAVDWDWSELADTMQPLIGSVAVGSGTDALDDLGLFDKATLGKLMQRTTDWSEARAAEMVGMRLVGGEMVPNPDAAWSIPDATRNMLRSTITAALENGDGTEQLAKAIRDDEAFGADRAETIARTEMATAQVQGQIAGWKASGLVAGRQFVAAPDCCDECQAQDGTIVALDDDMPEGDAPLHPKCRCTEVAVLPEDMPDDAGDLDKAYSDNQPRDDKGRWTAGGGDTVGETFATRSDAAADMSAATDTASGFREVGIRVDDLNEGSVLAVGQEVPVSRVWDDGTPTAETLAGTSTLGVKGGGSPSSEQFEAALKTLNPTSYSGYYGNVIYVVGSADRGHSGEDAGERILSSPKVIAAYFRDNPMGGPMRRIR